MSKGCSRLVFFSIVASLRDAVTELCPRRLTLRFACMVLIALRAFCLFEAAYGAFGKY